MSETPTKLVINCSTGERQEIPLSAEEIAEREALAAAAEEARLAEEATAAAKAEAKASAHEKLAALGLTEEEIAALTA
jgi:hypothetical protein